jgi:hypothetical protein
VTISLVIVTRGVSLRQQLATVPDEWEVVCWDNGLLCCWAVGPGHNGRAWSGPSKLHRIPYNLGAYGRYAAVGHAKGDRIVFADDDCVIATEDYRRLEDEHQEGVLTALMPASRTDYDDTVLIGWGAIFDRDLPEFAFARWAWETAAEPDPRAREDSPEFRVIGADFVFPFLTPHRRLDAEHEDLPVAHAENRTWRSPGYQETKAWYLDRLRQIRAGQPA